jgi:ribose transport system substrate-binding protein
MRRTLPITVSLTAVVIAATAACSTTGASSSSSGGASEGKKLSDVTVGFAQRELDAPYYSAMVKQAQDIAKQKGFKLLVQNANSDPVTQINQINTMVSQGADLIIADAVSPQAEKAQLAQVAKTTPLMFIDTGIEGVGFTSVQSNNVEIGTDSGKLLAERIGSGKTVNLAILNGGPTDEIVGPDRQKGMLAGLKAGGVTANVVASSSGAYAKDKAVPATEDMLSAHPDINVIVGLNDAMALGAMDVLKQQNRTDVLVAASADGQKEALQAIKDGGCTGQYVSTGLNSPKLATDEVMQIAQDVTTGKKKTNSYPANSYTKAAGIGCKNVDDFLDPNSIF